MIENVRTKCIICGEAYRIRIKKFKQDLPEIYSKSTNIAIAACKFLKFLQGSMLPDPPRAFLVFQSVLNLFCRKKIRLKKVEIMPSPPFKISRYATDCTNELVSLWYYICKFYSFFKVFVILFFNIYVISRLFRCL